VKDFAELAQSNPGKYVIIRYYIMKTTIFLYQLAIICIINLFAVNVPAQDNTPVTVMNLSLKDVITLTYKNNRSINNALLKRKSDQFDLLVEKDRFNPDLTISTSTSRSSSLDKQKKMSRIRSTIDHYSVSTDVSVKLKTGADLSLTWDGYQKRQSSSAMDYLNNYGYDDTKNIYDHQTELRFTQPLLKGFGVKVNTGPLKIAEINEEISKLTLKKTQITILTNAIITYRNLLYAQQQYEISKKSLDVSTKQYELNKKLVERGRMASLDLVQSENDVANKRIALVLSENQLQQKQFDLIQILDIETNHSIRATDRISVENITGDRINLDHSNLIMVALLNNPDLLIALAQQRISEINNMLASNYKQFDLSFTAGYSNNAVFDHMTTLFSHNYDTKNDSWDVGLFFTHTFGDLSDDQNCYRSKVNLRIAKNNVIDEKEN
jgi:hypothetical protein